MKSRSIIALLAATSLLTACSQPMGQAGGGMTQGGGTINKQDIGTIAGAIGGGIIGSNVGGGKGAIAGTIAGTLLGGALGSSIGSSLDRADATVYDDASQRALETAKPNQTLPWKGQNASGTITPSGYYKDASGRYCREYTQKIVVAGKTQQGHGTACRNPDGTWQIVE